jgi:hypothetical protein
MVLTPFKTGYSQNMGRDYEGGSAEYLMNGEVRILRATTEPCIVCGEPGGNCAGELEAPKHLVGSTTFPSLGHEDTYVVPEDVWREVNISDKTTTKVLVARKGAVMPLSKAEELGLC